MKVRPSRMFRPGAMWVTAWTQPPQKPSAPALSSVSATRTPSARAAGAAAAGATSDIDYLPFSFLVRGPHARDREEVRPHRLPRGLGLPRSHRVEDLPVSLRRRGQSRREVRDA